MGVVADPESAWDGEYRRGRYAGEPCVGFVGRIRAELARRPRIRAGRGLYVGCGSGRNYVPLADSGLAITGIDVSGAAIRALARRAPRHAKSVMQADFAGYEGGMFEYVVSIQSFQHGTQERTAGYFARAARMLGPGGLLFLRVNSSSTAVCRRHTVVERSASGGFTVRYEEGPKRGLDIRFYSLEDIMGLCGGFVPLAPAEEKTVARRPPDGGSWSQWEVILERT